MSLETFCIAIDNVANWSFHSLHDKVLGSLETSCGKRDESVLTETRQRFARFVL